MAIENTRQIVRELLIKTDSREIKWVNTYESSDKLIFRHVKKITSKKNLSFTLCSSRIKSHSDLTITFGPVDNNSIETLLKVITPLNQPLLYDLIDNINKKFNDGDVFYIGESMSFELSKGGEKLKNLKLINQIIKDTESGKLTWENTFKDKIGAIFIAKVAITKLKHLILSLKVTENSEIQQDNALRVLLKICVDEPIISTKTQKIRNISLNEYPTLRVLIGKLYKTYLGKDFKYPFDKPKVDKSIAVIAEDLEEYKKQILDSVKDIIRDIPTSSTWENRFADLCDCYDQIKKAQTMKEINQLFFKVSEIIKDNPIGTPRWVR